MDQDPESGDYRHSLSIFLYLAGARYWSASLLPALVGTTLPLWLSPSDFSFRWDLGILFLFATLLFHAGFSFLYFFFQQDAMFGWSKSKLFAASFISIVFSCVLGLYINRNLPLNQSVFGGIFLVFGFSALFVGLLYTTPPFRFSQRPGGEIVLSYSLAMLPVLGAHLIQTGDLIRKVYLASLPIIVATAIWVWIVELGNASKDQEMGRLTLVASFGPRVSGRYILVALLMTFFASIILAVISFSLSPLVLFSLLTVGLLWKILTVAWESYDNPVRLFDLRKYGFTIHFTTCSILIASSLVAPFL